MHTICTRTVHVYICISGIGIPCLHRIVSPFFSATFLGGGGRKEGRGGVARCGRSISVSRIIYPLENNTINN